MNFTARLGAFVSVTIAGLALYSCGGDTPPASNQVSPTVAHEPPTSHGTPFGFEGLRTFTSRPQVFVLRDPPNSNVQRDVIAGRTLDAKVLVIAADGTEVDLPAIQQTLDYVGTPYELYIASAHPGGLTADKLATGAAGHYEAVILTTGSLVYNSSAGWTSALSAAEWQALANYEASYGVRQVTYYTFPTPDYGFGPATAVSTDTTPIDCTVTSAGAAALPYVNPTNPVTIRMAYTYLATPTDATTTPLLTDSAGHALAAVHTYPDGRENLALTFDNNPNLTHSLQLGFSLLWWATRGVFLGELHPFAAAQVDDVFIDDDEYGTTGAIYRITGADFTAVDAWQRGFQRQPLGAGFRVDMAYNAAGTVADDGEDSSSGDTVQSQSGGLGGLFGLLFGSNTPLAGALGAAAPVPGDTLTPAARTLQGDFKWISHTWDHENLDALSYAQCQDEFQRDIDAAGTLGLRDFHRESLVTPDISGLTNADCMRAAFDVGIRYVVSDTSRPEGQPASPNVGIVNGVEPGILEVPRHPTNLFYNVTTPDEWVAEYNVLYRAYWGRDLSYAEIVDFESDALVRYLLRGDVDPWMFHEANLRAYDGTHTLLGDLLDRTMAKYGALVTLPWVSDSLYGLGHRVAQRAQYNSAGVTATITPGASITVHATSGVTVPVTGTGTTASGGQYISYANVPAGGSVTLALH